MIQCGTPRKQRAVVLDLRGEAEVAGLDQASKRGEARGILQLGRDNRGEPNSS